MPTADKNNGRAGRLKTKFLNKIQQRAAVVDWWQQQCCRLIATPSPPTCLQLIKA
jgi:hypothetical protein